MTECDCERLRRYRKAHPELASLWLRARARFHIRLAARGCCREHGTTCPKCREWDYRFPRWLVYLRDLYDAARVIRRG